MKYFIFISTLLVLASCSPQRRLARLVEKHPELVRTDTVWTTVTVPADTIRITEMVYLKADSAEIRLITDSLFALIDSTTLSLPAARETVYKYLTRVVPGAVTLPTDTMFISDGKGSVEVWFDGDQLKGRFIRKGFDIDVPAEVTNIEPVRNVLRWYWLVILLFIGYAAGRWFSPKG